MRLFSKTFAGVVSLLILNFFALTSIAGINPGAAVKEVFGANGIAIEDVEDAEQARMVVPGGTPFGIKMHTRGVLVVGLSDIQSGNDNVNPAKDAGLKIGDILIRINGIIINRNKDVSRFVAESGGEEVEMTVIREGDEMELFLTPVKSEYDEAYKAGIWVRDSSAGIGTMTYYDPESLVFAGLGHAVCDVDTGELMPLFSGEIVDVNITDVNAGISGRPGELKGVFLTDKPLGRLYLNSMAGIYGFLENIPYHVKAVPMARREELSPGPAEILVTVSGNKPRSFNAMIERVSNSETSPNKNMVIKITDPELLRLCGGIVQGMSGSPILQDGKLAGAVTHVFVNDPTRGYGIFAENMEQVLNLVENGQNEEDTH